MTGDVPDIEFTDHPLNLLYKPVEFLEWSNGIGGTKEAADRLLEALRPYQEEHGNDALLVFLWRLSATESQLKEQGLAPSR